MRNTTRAVLLIALAALIAFATPQAKAAPSSPSFEATVQPFLAKNCYTCHNPELSSGGMDLTQYKTRAAVASDPNRWALIVKRLTNGEMPPQGMPRPNSTELHAAAAWIESELDRNIKPDPGRVTARRLNRAEYNYTVKDLLGVDYRPADDFPQDDTGYGFDTIGDVLSLSVVQMEKYLSAAETVARTAVYGPQDVKAKMVKYQPSGRRRPGDFDNLFFNTHPWLSVLNYDESGLSMPNSFHVMHRFPVTADYVIRATPDNGSRPPGSEPLEVAAFVDGKVVGAASIDGQLEGRTQEFHARITAGEHWIAVGFPRQFEGLPALYDARNPSKRPAPAGRRGGGPAPGGTAPATAADLAGAPGGVPLTGPPRAARGGRGVLPSANNNNDDAASNVFFTPPGAPPGTRLSRPDNMGFQSLEIGGPNNPEVHPSAESLKAIFTCDIHTAGCGRSIIASLARRAYRRPVTTQEVNELAAQMERVKQRGDSPEEQVVVGIEALLISPNFLFRIEKDHAPAGSHYLSDYELASRLSYFLWSSMPDDELARAAERGTLRHPEVLKAQLHRMLQDPKSSRLVETFGGQWLQFRGLESHQPDFYLYPAFDNYLRISMTQETQMFFENMIKEDRSVLDFLDADYTFVNEYLGQYYGLRDVKGPEFRKVSLDGTPRRGILGQASMLTVSSYGNRTSVVLRGKWVLDNLLNMPPPPPPPNVPDLDQTQLGSDATLRQRMEVHRANAVCATCHSKMDPIGFGLENFDAVGNWRDKDGKAPIDASGRLPDGRTFNGPVELAKLLRSQKDAFTGCMTEKMMIYSLGRGLEAYDRPALKKIAAGVSSGQYRFSSMVLEIVQSMPFQMRKGEPPL